MCFFFLSLYYFLLTLPFFPISKFEETSILSFVILSEIDNGKFQVLYYEAISLKADRLTMGFRLLYYFLFFFLQNLIA